MPPSYEQQEFWESRFKTETHFEWLGDGQDTLIPVLRTHLQTPPFMYTPAHPPYILHIGAGSSTLSDAILDEYRKIYGTSGAIEHIVNVDFAQEAVDRGRERAKEMGHGEVAWEQVDLLDLDDIVSLRAGVFQSRSDELFEIVLDKSTSDAISCGEDTVLDKKHLTKSPKRLHPWIAAALSASPKDILTLSRLDVLAVHLALLVRPGGIWIVLSYSKRRFPSFQEVEEGDVDRLGVDRFWSLKGVVPVTVSPKKGGSEGETTVHTPEISHYLYVLRRTDVAVE